MSSCVDTTGFPAITAVINTYNASSMLPRALDSVLAQVTDFSGGDLEIVVADDCSTDCTPSIIKQYEQTFTDSGCTFKAFTLASNSGYQCVPKNAAIEMSRGTYIRFLDADNEWMPGSLRLLYDSAREGDVWPDVVYGRREYVRDEGAPTHGPGGEPLLEGRSELVQHDPRILAVSPLFNYIDTGDMLLSRGVFWWLNEWTGQMWNESRRRFGDWELVCRMACLDRLTGAAPPRFKALDAIVSRYHWHSSNLQLTRPVVETPHPVTAAYMEKHAPQA